MEGGVNIYSTEYKHLNIKVYLRIIPILDNFRGLNLNKKNI